jgi:hypothetical protein
MLKMSNNKDDVVEGDIDIPAEPSNKAVALPTDVALLPIRNRVLLPGGLLRLTIGRPKSVSSAAPKRVVNACYCPYMF